MFMGQYRHNIDDKGRLTIPARYRDLLADGAYITQGFDKNLMVWPSVAFESIYQRVNQKSITDQTTRLLRRLIFSSGEQVSVDRVGRILVPQFLRNLVGLDGEVVVVGVGDYFEIWSPTTWDDQLAQLQDADANAQRFAAFDLSAG
jgi:MraZ protein